LSTDWFNFFHQAQKRGNGLPRQAIANDVLALVKKLGVVDAKVDGRIVIQ
jgi:hypothetical protein